MPVRQRRVIYHITAVNKAGITSFSTSQGYETVEERPYCLEHAPTVSPAIVGQVTKSFSYLSLDPRKFKGD